MSETRLAEHVEFLTSARGEDEATVLAAALRAGVEALYREALIDGFLTGRISREQILREIGAEPLAQIEYQRDALRRDVEWGLRGASDTSASRPMPRQASRGPGWPESPPSGVPTARASQKGRRLASRRAGWPEWPHSGLPMARASQKTRRLASRSVGLARMEAFWLAGGSASQNGGGMASRGTGSLEGGGA